MNIWPGCSLDDWCSIPSRSGDFYFQYGTQTLGLFQHPPSSHSLYESIVLYLHSLICSRVWSLMKHKDKFTFTSCKYRWHYIPHLTVECKKNVITNESIPTFEKEITTSFGWLGVHVLKRSPIRQHRIKKAQIIPERSNMSSKWHIFKNASHSGWIQFIHFVTTLYQIKAQSVIQLLALE